MSQTLRADIFTPHAQIYASLITRNNLLSPKVAAAVAEWLNTATEHVRPSGTVFGYHPYEARDAMVLGLVNKGRFSQSPLRLEPRQYTKIRAAVSSALHEKYHSLSLEHMPGYQTGPFVCLDPAPVIGFLGLDAQPRRSATILSNWKNLQGQLFAPGSSAQKLRRWVVSHVQKLAGLKS